MNHLDFNLLLDLDALLREGSVVGAARRLHLSAPAMSRRLTRLREAVGDPLFVPAGRGLVPTPRALALRDKLQSAIEQVRGVFMPDAVDFARLERNFTLRANDGFACAWATRLAANIASEAPGVALHFIPRADKHIEALRNGSVDLDLGVPGTTDAEIRHEALFDAVFVGVARAAHPMFDKQNALVGLDDFIAWPHISASKRGIATGRIDEELMKHGVRRQVRLVAPGFQAALVMVANSDMLTAVPEPFARWSQQHHQLRIFRLPVSTPIVSVAQSWHARHDADPVHAWLRAHVRALCLADSHNNQFGPAATKPQTRDR